jgi:hypothetical protein
LVYLEIDELEEEDDEDKSWRTTMAKRRMSTIEEPKTTSMQEALVW